MSSLPKLNTFYWLMMVLSTTMGELIGNLLSRNLELGYTQGAIADVSILAALTAAISLLKFKNHFFYWLLILVANIGGTNIADWVTLDPLDGDMKWGILKPLQLGTKAGSLVVLGSLILVLLARYVVVKRRGENASSGVSLYWIAILLSSTFGTTSGDFITNDTPFGALGGSLLLLVILIAVYVAFRMKRLAASPAYWTALVLVHPIGATIGNYVSKPIGLNLGNIYTNVAMAIFFSIFFFMNTKIEQRSSNKSEAQIQI